MSSHVLVVSTVLDLATDAVVRSLHAGDVRCTRLNTEQYPFDVRMTTTIPEGTRAPETIISNPLRERASLADVSSVWYRRVRVPEKPDAMDPGVYEFCIRESRSALLGLLLAAVPSSARWMSHPVAIWSAEHKLLQLAAAKSLGLPVPDTVVTNDPAVVRATYDRFDGAMIAKPVRGGYIEVANEPYGIYTSQVRAEHLIDLSGVELSPVIYQPLIPKQCDVRVTVVGDQLFSAAIESQQNPAARVDWRRTDDANLPHRPFTLPHAVADQVLALLGALNLKFGAVDFVLTPDEQLVFLEVNPSGQWLWLDAKLELGITGAVAAWLSARNEAQ